MRQGDAIDTLCRAKFRKRVTRLPRVEREFCLLKTCRYAGKLIHNFLLGSVTTVVFSSNKNLRRGLMWLYVRLTFANGKNRAL